MATYAYPPLSQKITKYQKNNETNKLVTLLFADLHGEEKYAHLTINNKITDEVKETEFEFPTCTGIKGTESNFLVFTTIPQAKIFTVNFIENEQPLVEKESEWIKIWTDHGCKCLFEFPKSNEKLNKLVEALEGKLVYLKCKLLSPNLDLDFLLTTLEKTLEGTAISKLGNKSEIIEKGYLKAYLNEDDLVDGTGFEKEHPFYTVESEYPEKLEFLIAKDLPPTALKGENKKGGGSGNYSISPEKRIAMLSALLGVDIKEFDPIAANFKRILERSDREIALALSITGLSSFQYTKMSNKYDDPKYTKKLDDYKNGKDKEELEKEIEKDLKDFTANAIPVNGKYLEPDDDIVPLHPHDEEDIITIKKAQSLLENLQVNEPDEFTDSINYLVNEIIAFTGLEKIEQDLVQYAECLIILIPFTLGNAKYPQTRIKSRFRSVGNFTKDTILEGTLEELKSLIEKLNKVNLVPVMPTW